MIASQYNCNIGTATPTSAAAHLTVYRPDRLHRRRRWALTANRQITAPSAALEWPSQSQADSTRLRRQQRLPLPPLPWTAPVSAQSRMRPSAANAHHAWPTSIVNGALKPVSGHRRAMGRGISRRLWVLAFRHTQRHAICTHAHKTMRLLRPSTPFWRVPHQPRSAHKHSPVRLPRGKCHC